MTLGTHAVVWRSPVEILGRYNMKASDELCPLHYQHQLREGMEIEFEGAWFEIFMYDHVRDLYAIERVV